MRMVRRNTLTLLAAATLAAAAAVADAQTPVPDVSIAKSTLSAFGNGTPAGPDDADVPNIPPGEPVTWRYTVSNRGETSVPFSAVEVTDDQPGLLVGFLGVFIGDADNLFEPGEVWLFQAMGTALDLAHPPAAVTVVPDACTHGDTERPRPAYRNVGTVVIPGATASDPSFYCNPHAVDVPVAGHRARLSESVTPSRRKNLFGLRDPAIDLNGLDPTVTGVMVHVGSVGAGSMATFDLPAAGWRRAGGPNDFRYRSRTGPVGAAWLRDGKLIRLSASGADAYPLGRPQGDVGIVVDVAGVRFCTVFGGAISQDDGHEFEARFADPPAACP